MQTRAFLNLLQLFFSTWFEENKILDATAGFYIFSLFFSGQIIAATRSGDEPNFLEAQLLLKTFLFQWSCMVSQLVNLQVAFFSNHGVCSDFFSFFFLPCLICNWTLPGDGPRRCCPQLCVRAAVTALNTETPHDTLLFFCFIKVQLVKWFSERGLSERPLLRKTLNYIIIFILEFDLMVGGNTLNQPPHEFFKLFFFEGVTVYLHCILLWGGGRWVNGPRRVWLVLNSLCCEHCSENIPVSWKQLMKQEQEEEREGAPASFTKASWFFFKNVYIYVFFF